MKLGDFIIQTFGSKLDFDKAFGAQCVDLIRFYCQDVLGIPDPEKVEGAQEFYTNHETRPIQNRCMDRAKIFEKGQFIPAGAIVVFSATKTNKFGHIGICVRSEPDRIWLLQQDGFTQAGVEICSWKYDTALGYLVKKDVIL